MIAPIDKVRGEGNCGRATDRGEEARECVRKCRPDFAAGRILTSSCEATNRNVIQGRRGQASEHNITKPFPDRHAGKWRACAATDHVLPWKRPLVRGPDRDVPHCARSRSQPGVGPLSFPRPQRSTIPTSKRLTRGDSGTRLESFVEPPYADPHVRWCGRRRQR